MVSQRASSPVRFVGATAAHVNGATYSGVYEWTMARVGIWRRGDAYSSFVLNDCVDFMLESIAPLNAAAAVSNIQQDYGSVLSLIHGVGSDGGSRARLV